MDNESQFKGRYQKFILSEKSIHDHCLRGTGKIAQNTIHNFTVASNFSTFGIDCLFHSVWCNII